MKSTSRSAIVSSRRRRTDNSVSIEEWSDPKYFFKVSLDDVFNCDINNIDLKSIENLRSFLKDLIVKLLNRMELVESKTNTLYNLDYSAILRHLDNDADNDVNFANEFQIKTEYELENDDNLYDSEEYYKTGIDLPVGFCTKCGLELPSNDLEICSGCCIKTKVVFKCQRRDCTEVFDDISKLIIHRQFHRDVGVKSKSGSTHDKNSSSATCKICGKTYKHKQHLSRHMKISHSDVKDFTCTFCKRRFPINDYLVQHQKLCRANPGRLLRPGSSVPMIVSCRKCRRGFSSIMKYIRHFKADELCVQCGKTFTGHGLNEHWRECHPSKDIVYEADMLLNVVLPPPLTTSNKMSCIICRRVLSSKLSFNQHYQTHLGKRFSCLKCDMSFTLNSQLKQHVIVRHSDTRNFMCDDCGKGFVYAKTLNQHILTHTRVRNYTCDICGKAFLQFGHLHRHKMIHSSGPKRFPCLICGKRFHDRGNLKQHTRTHIKK